jgi:hypothetical protein
MRPLTIALTLISVAAIDVPFASAQSDRPVPPLPLTTPNGDCQRGSSALAVPSETVGSANLSDELSRSKGVICPPAGIDPGISAIPWAAALCRLFLRRARRAEIPT